MPVLAAGTDIEVTGHHCEGMARIYNGEKQYWLHPLLVNSVQAIAWLNESGTYIKVDGQNN